MSEGVVAGPVSGSSRRRLSIITLDQVVAGGSSVLVALLSAHLLGTAAFGLFGLLFILSVVAQGLTRALVCEPLLVHPDDARTRVGAPLGAALLLGCGAGTVIAAAGLIVEFSGLPLGPELLILGAALPLLTLQDLGRYIAFAIQRPGRALVLDMTRLVTLCALMAMLYVRDVRSLTWFSLVWAATGALAGALVLVQHHRRPTGGLSWLRERWGFSWRYLLSFTAMQGAVLTFSITVAAIAGAVALGAMRGALLLVRPFMAFQTAAIASGISEIANDRTESAARRHLWRTTAVTSVMAAVNVALLLLIPASIGRLILADTWDDAAELLVPTCAYIVGIALIGGPRSYLAGRRAIQRVVRLDLAGTVFLLVAGIVGVVTHGVHGAMWGTAIGQGLAALLWWTGALRGVSQPPDEESVT